MSFRTYAPNPTLQRMRSLNNPDGPTELFRPVHVENYVPSSTEPFQLGDVAYDMHTISDYGELAAPHSFAVTTHDPKRLRQRRSYSTTGPSSTGTHLPRHNEAFSTGHKTNDVSAGEETVSEGSSSCSSDMSPTTPGDESGSNTSVMLTGRPVFVPDHDLADDLESAVILKAKGEKLTWVKPTIISCSWKEN